MLCAKKISILLRPCRRSVTWGGQTCGFAHHKHTHPSRPGVVASTTNTRSTHKRRRPRHILNDDRNEIKIPYAPRGPKPFPPDQNRQMMNVHTRSQGCANKFNPFPPPSPFRNNKQYILVDRPFARTYVHTLCICALKSMSMTTTMLVM